MFSRESNADYLNPTLPIAQRVSDLLGRMTLEEKVGQMMQLDARTGELDELIVKRHVGSILHTSPDDLVRAAQIVRNETRLGIPLLVGDDCIHGYSFWPGATIFPSQLGMACSWDARKVEEAARITAEEVACTGVHWTFSPVLCIGRDTRWGRIDETFGEDPVLIGELASAMVKGYQKHAQAADAFAEDAILACAKHFAGYSYTQGGRDASEADLTKRALESWFLPPFERVAKEGCATFMLGYEAIDGTPVTFNKWLLSDKLRGEWDYHGTLVTDWDNVGRAVWEQHIKPDYETASADAVKAGNDLIMTTPGFYEGAIDAVNNGMLDESLIDDAVARLLTLKFQLGLFENPRLPDRERIAATIGTDAHMQANLELTRESIVLLRNNGALPLAAAGAEAPRRIAVSPMMRRTSWETGLATRDKCRGCPRGSRVRWSRRCSTAYASSRLTVAMSWLRAARTSSNWSPIPKVSCFRTGSRAPTSPSPRPSTRHCLTRRKSWRAARTPLSRSSETLCN